MMITSAMHWLSSRGALRHGGVNVERLPDDEAATVRQGVPVVLPVRQHSPGGSYGTADEGHLLCLAVFPIGVRLPRHPGRDRGVDSGPVEAGRGPLRAATEIGHGLAGTHKRSSRSGRMLFW